MKLLDDRAGNGVRGRALRRLDTAATRPTQRELTSWQVRGRCAIMPEPRSKTGERGRVLKAVRDFLTEAMMDEATLLKRITVNPDILGGKPTIRGRRLAVEHLLGMLAAGDSPETILQCYEWLEREDILACLAFARRLVGRERVEPLSMDGIA